MNREQRMRFGELMGLKYRHRAEICDEGEGSPLNSDIFYKMEEKKSNLALAADIDDIDKFLGIVDLVGGEVIVIKTHLDLMEYPEYKDIERVIFKLVELSQKHGFYIFEDRKFADIGKTVRDQYVKGVFRIVEWSDITNAHSLPGPGVIEGLYAGAKPKMMEAKFRGLLMLAQMTPEGNLATPEYTMKTIEMSNQFPEFVSGYIGAGSVPEKLREELACNADIKHIIMTPGVKIGAKAGELGQRYAGPEEAIYAGSDIIIVGSGIHGADDPLKQAKLYREIAWEAYEKKGKMAKM